MTVDMVNLSNKPLCSWRVGIPLFYLHGHANQWLGRVRTRNRNQMHFDLKKQMLWMMSSWWHPLKPREKQEFAIMSGPMSSTLRIKWNDYMWFVKEPEIFIQLCLWPHQASCLRLGTFTWQNAKCLPRLRMRIYSAWSLIILSHQPQRTISKHGMNKQWAASLALVGAELLHLAWPGARWTVKHEDITGHVVHFV